MRSRWTATRGVRFVRRLRAVAVRRHAVVDRREVRLVVCPSTERGNDVVYRVGARLLADVADASVATEYARS